MSSVSNFMALSNSEIVFFFNAAVYEHFQQHCLHEVNKLPFYCIPELEYAT